MTREEKRHVIKLIVTIIITTAFFFVEIIYGHITNSLALIGDSYNMLSNILSMFLGLACIKLTQKQSSKSTFGWARAEITGALINAVFLVALCFTILVNSIQRLFDDQRIDHPETLLFVGLAGLGVNLLGLVLFFNETCGGACKRRKKDGQEMEKEDGEEEGSRGKKVQRHDDVDDGGIYDCQRRPSQGSIQLEIDNNDLEVTWRREKMKKIKTGSEMNIEGVFLHILGDALGSVVVVLSALAVIHAEGSWKYKVDPGLSIIMVIIVAVTTLPLIKQTSFILLQHLPGHMVVPDMLKEMCDKVKGLHGLHELHIWQLVGDRIIASMHIKSTNLEDFKVTSRRLKKFFNNNGIHSLTIQPEFSDSECMVTEFNGDSLTNNSTTTTINDLSTPEWSPMDASFDHHDNVFFSNKASKPKPHEEVPDVFLISKKYENNILLHDDEFSKL